MLHIYERGLMFEPSAFFINGPRPERQRRTRIIRDVGWVDDMTDLYGCYRATYLVGAERRLVYEDFETFELAAETVNMMAFSFNPDDGPARIMRFVPHDEMPGNDVAATLDAKQNLLVIDDDAFVLLNGVDKHRLLRTQEKETRVVYGRDGMPRLAR